MTPSGTRGVLNDAISIYFADLALANAFGARWCIGFKVESAEGAFWARADEPAHAGRGGAAQDTVKRTACDAMSVRTQNRTPAGIVPGSRNRRLRMGGYPIAFIVVRTASGDLRFQIPRAQRYAYRCSPGAPQTLASSYYLCSLGTNTVLGKVTNGLFGVLLDDGPEN
jgi:hypothetical protein